MKKRMTKLMAMLVAVVMCMVLAAPALAAEVKMPENALLENNEEYFLVFWENAKKSGFITINVDGTVCLSSEARVIAKNEDIFQQGLGLVEKMNRVINLKLAVMDPSTLELQNLNDLSQEAFELITEEGEKANHEFLMNEMISENPILRIEPVGHTCSYRKLNVGNLCSANYRQIQNEYSANLSIGIYNPNYNPSLATTIYWIGLVKPGGAWDYKQESLYGPYNNWLCVTYKNHVSVHKTAEWLGNYNYGYTGSILYGLNILHFGSSAVDKFDPRDQLDWPAIDEGYYDARS